MDFKLIRSSQIVYSINRIRRLKKKKSDTSASLSISDGDRWKVLKIEGYMLLLNVVTILNKTAWTNFKIVFKLS